MPIQNAIGIPPTSSPNGRFNALSLPQATAYENLLLNPSFEVLRPASGVQTPAAAWTFTPNVAGAGTASTTIGAFAWNESTVPARNYLEYTQTAQNGVRGTIECRIPGAASFAGQALTFSWWLWSSVDWAGSSLQITQNFGTGGSPSASVAVNATVNGQTTWTIPANTWTLFTGTVQVPSVASATLGTNGDDFLSLSLRPGGTTIGTVRIAAPGVYLGSIAPPYRARSPQIERIISSQNNAYSTANLPPSGSFIGDWVSCSDCLTTLGVGSIVFWDGSIWRTAIDAIQPTTSLLTFFRRLVGIGNITAKSPRTLFYLDEYFGSAGEFPAGVAAVTGNGANWNTPTNNGYGVLGLTTGGSTTGFSARAMQSNSHPIPTAGTAYFGVKLRLPFLPTSTEDFIIRSGASTLGLGNGVSSIGIEILCDRFGVASSGGASENFLIRGVNGGAAQSIDSGVALSNNFVIFEYLATDTSAAVFVNQAQVGTLTTVPTTNYGIRHSINKLAGTGNRQFLLDWSAFGFRYTVDYDRFL